MHPTTDISPFMLSRFVQASLLQVSFSSVLVCFIIKSRYPYSWKHFDVVTPLRWAPRHADPKLRGETIQTVTDRVSGLTKCAPMKDFPALLYFLCSLLSLLSDKTPSLTITSHDFLEGDDGKYRSQCVLRWSVQPLKLLTTLRGNKYISLTDGG